MSNINIAAYQIPISSIDLDIYTEKVLAPPRNSRLSLPRTFSQILGGD